MEEEMQPFWVQSATNHRRVDRYRRRLSSFFFNSALILILVSVTAVCFKLFIIPSIVSVSSQIFRPNTVKKSWDSINIVLVLFALIFGFLSRNRNEDSSTSDEYRPNPISPTISDQPQNSKPSTPHQWYGYSDQTAYNYTGGNGTRMGGLRSSSSYPDLRESPTWITAHNRWRSFDDTEIYRVPEPDRRRRSWGEIEREDLETKNVVHAFSHHHLEQIPDTLQPPTASPPPVHIDDTLSGHHHLEHIPDTPPPPSSPPPPPPAFPPPPPAVTAKSVKNKTKRTFQSIPHDQKIRKTFDNNEVRHKTQTPPADLQPPPPPPPPVQYWEEKSSKSDKKRGGANATKDFLTALYHKNKKKRRQRQRSVDNLDTLLHQSQPAPVHYLRPPPSPPPPPPPPPPSVFHNLFSSKKSKRRNIPSTPPPPPPPPPTFTAARASRNRIRNAPLTSQKPLLPVKTSSFSSVEETSSSGGESPLYGIPPPPPPPPPPFKMGDWKFAAQGDYVKIQSSHSSRSGSPDLDELESPPTRESGNASTVLNGGGTTASPLFCPSPDVDTKADTFIAKFKAGLMLEKIDSFNKKQGLRMSNLGPGPTRN